MDLGHVTSWVNQRVGGICGPVSTMMVVVCSMLSINHEPKPYGIHCHGRALLHEYFGEIFQAFVEKTITKMDDCEGAYDPRFLLTSVFG